MVPSDSAIEHESGSICVQTVVAWSDTTVQPEEMNQLEDDYKSVTTVMVNEDWNDYYEMESQIRIEENQMSNFEGESESVITSHVTSIGTMVDDTHELSQSIDSFNNT